MAEFHMPTEASLDAITKRTALRRQRQLRAVAARYDRRLQRVMITLTNGTVVGFPLAVLPGLATATPEDLRKIQIEGGGYGLHVAALDADISIPHLLAEYLGSALMQRAMARAQASQSNGRLGGRPRKSVAA